MKKIKKVSKIPTFINREKEAKFWETHSIADFQDEFTPIKARFVNNLSEGLHVRLDPETLMKLRIEAKEKGIGPTTLVRMWVKEQLRTASAYKRNKKFPNCVSVFHVGSYFLMAGGLLGISFFKTLNKLKYICDMHYKKYWVTEGRKRTQ